MGEKQRHPNAKDKVILSRRSRRKACSLFTNKNCNTITENKKSVQVTNMLRQSTHQDLWKRVISDYFLGSKQRLEASLTQHREIARAIERKDVIGARKAMEERLTAAIDILKGRQ